MSLLQFATSLPRPTRSSATLLGKFLQPAAGPASCKRFRHAMARFIVVAAGVLVASQAGADNLPDVDQGGLAGVVNLPDSVAGADLLPPESYSLSLSSSTASHSILAGSNGESLILDGETTRLALNYRFRKSGKAEFGIDIPYIWHSPGQLDSFISSWHGFFGLPEGFRPQRAEDVLEISYSDVSGQRAELVDSTGGIGDLRLLAGWQLAQRAQSTTALRVSIKVPTGSSDRLEGSGSTDVSIGISRDARALWGMDRMGGFLHANAIYLGKPDVLADRYRSFVGQFSAGLSYALGDIVTLRLQTMLRSALYDSAIEILGEPSATIAVGGDIRLSPVLKLSLAVAEDIQAESAPDVSFQLALRYRPEQR